MPGGPQEAAFNSLTDEEKQTFRKDLERMLNRIHEEELPRTRIYVTNDERARWCAGALRKGAMVIKNRYSILLETDCMSENGEGLVVRVVLNATPMRDRLKDFLKSMGLGDVKPPVITKLLTYADTKGGITFHQVLRSTFDEKYSSRTTVFSLSEMRDAIFDKDEVVVTCDAWTKMVNLSLPANGDKPWGFHWVKDEAGNRTDSFFRFQLYGTLWREPRRENMA
jgi:hypothetical protein